MTQPSSTPTPLQDRRFKQMAPGEKLIFVGKALVFLVSGGFIYPTLWVD